MTQLEIEDIQGIIRRGYGSLAEANFVMLEIKDVAKAKQWISSMADKVTNGVTSPTPSDICINLAFTQSGFNQLGLPKAFEEDQGFSVEFEDGMAEYYRSQILGDTGDSAPEKWEWGGPNNQPVHISLMLYAGDKAGLENLYQREKTIWESNGLVETKKLGSELLPDRKEHFGFRDGIAQPNIAGLQDRFDNEADQQTSQKILDNGGSDKNILAAGEFVLGYKNIYEKYPSSPKVKKNSDTQNLLEDDGQGAKDLGKNGSYLVFRQLEQHVEDFWSYLDQNTKTDEGASDEYARDLMASKMVGRWRSGCPVVISPFKDQPEHRDADNFSYYPNDKDAEKCPMSSHIRRTNPRNSPLQRSDDSQDFADVALRDANKHRIIRRGRAYGSPIAPSMEPSDILKTGQSVDKKVGLQFLCFNANLGRQFEFIQHTWINNPKFAELYSDADPLLGEHDPKYVGEGVYGHFTAPGLPLRERVGGLKRFVDVKGGAYFFMPGIKALKYLGSLK